MGGLRVLLVEDDRLIRWWMASCLEREGLMVVAPVTFEEAVRAGTMEPFDVLVSDWRLENGHNGIEVLAAVRSALPKITSILVSAEVDDTLTRRARDAGFDHVIPKPQRSAELLAALQRLRTPCEPEPELDCPDLLRAIHACA